jgi:hypothetical protein
MLLCRTGHCPANQAKPGLGNFCPAYASLIAIALLQKSRYALPLRSRPPSFYLISSEAVLLTGEEEKIFTMSLQCRSVNKTNHSRSPNIPRIIT